MITAPQARQQIVHMAPVDMGLPLDLSAGLPPPDDETYLKLDLLVLLDPLINVLSLASSLWP
jgi:hypothetical protein